MCELCICNQDLVTAFRPSLIAAGCVSMTRRLTRKPNWSTELEQYSGYSEDNVREILASISRTLKELTLSPLTQYIKRKYVAEKFFSVSKLIENVVGQVVNP